ncbi:Protein of unknown function [Propionibacterium freudenreichii]|uniref:Uncharacterized protein n=2 Tax=Propionibacterium freudenreichii TaxID=1744 RepID=D7GJ76_PROFC|nr:Hypothetical protein PFREUD_06180 [Propionibacterium freudenreichii subsp. shermanii CIRM-BIA1]CDP47904.1 Protein of unknown function [Propionibacterium freudenreichii subsp. freudenreichii]CEG85197.1 Protein of unknown function [Propionibacterium freudenreichii]CEG89151.1 Protein of unknown function [Propionibacterium freudenreichii]CEG89377.1 Protein of unknown function [Propionibacterium freudenreichii]
MGSVLRTVEATAEE